MLDQLRCTGSEPRLFNCIHNPLGVHDCSHFEDAGVRCPAPPTARKLWWEWGGEVRNGGRKNGKVGHADIICVVHLIEHLLENNRAVPPYRVYKWHREASQWLK